MMIIAPTKKTVISDAEKRRLEDFLAAIDLFADIEPNMPLQMPRTFIVTALYEGEGPLR